MVSGNVISLCDSRGVEKSNESSRTACFEWSEPRWSYRPRVKAELSQVLNLKMWLRLFSLVVLLTALLAHTVKRRFPDLEFNWVGAVAASFAILAAMMGCFALALWVGAPVIQITSKGLSRQHGQSPHWRLRSAIRSVTINTTDPLHPRLLIEAQDRHPLECGIAPEVSLGALADFLKETFPEVLVKEER